MNSYHERINHLHDILLRMEVTGRDGSTFQHDDALAELVTMTEMTRTFHKTIFMIGNGASASMASHIAADLCKNGNLCTEVFTDLALITAVANDMGADHLYSAPLERRGTPGDLLVAISSSGRSPNILEAVKVARKLNMSVVTFSAMGADNPLRQAGDLNFYVAAPTYGQAESAHAVLLHLWVDSAQCNG